MKSNILSGNGISATLPCQNSIPTPASFASLRAISTKSLLISNPIILNFLALQARLQGNLDQEQLRGQSIHLESDWLLLLHMNSFRPIYAFWYYYHTNARRYLR